MFFELQFYLNFVITYLLSSVYSIYKDYSNFEEFPQKKIQGFSYEQIFKTYKKVIPLVCTNLFVSSLPCSIILCKILPDNVFDLDNFNVIYSIINFFMLKVLTDIFFYICHRLFHTKYFYRFHKIHHEIKAPVGISAIYAHPIDFCLANILPIFLPCYFIYTNIVMIHIWIFLTTWNTINIAHSGYIDVAEYHDNHHKYFKYNYGTNCFMDDLFGTKK
jgi:sterol desaturase/sphingolipid hydroxylase (fatty acid hydroxylase superfamily)|tara:strand:+ start:40 stop:693 length:654 start_codon:yes stop_codon:yes gene_type:complete